MSEVNFQWRLWGNEYNLPFWLNPHTTPIHVLSPGCGAHWLESSACTGLCWPSARKHWAQSPDCFYNDIHILRDSWFCVSSTQTLDYRAKLWLKVPGSALSQHPGESPQGPITLKCGSKSRAASSPGHVSSKTVTANAWLRKVKVLPGQHWHSPVPHPVSESWAVIQAAFSLPWELCAEWHPLSDTSHKNTAKGDFGFPSLILRSKGDITMWKKWWGREKSTCADMSRTGEPLMARRPAWGNAHPCPSTIHREACSR